MSIKKFHGAEPRGLLSTPQSSSLEGRFGRMFRTLPSATHSVEDLAALGKAMVADPENPPTPETEIDGEENQGIDAGYTYFGQFIDHDLTFDPASSLQKQNDPNGLEDFRTPRFDLDNVYGRDRMISLIYTMLMAYIFCLDENSQGTQKTQTAEIFRGTLINGRSLAIQEMMRM
ncbi:MAG: hypothetical protein QM764_09110 [Chitinophagaceae bacterium]